MKYIVGLLPLFFVGNLLATNLCDSTCNLSITFPDGGSIKAKDEITLTFGEGGFINNGSSTIAYSVGEQLKLARKKSIKFQNDGVFDLGRGGNIKYSDMKIVSNGVAELAAIDGKELVSFEEMSLNGDITVNISSDFEVVNDGSLKIKDGLVVATSDLTFTNYGYVKGYFEFDSAVLTYIDEESSDDDDDDDDDGKEKSVFETILEKLNGSTQSEPEEGAGVETQEISGKVYFKTNRKFTVISTSIDSELEPEEEAIDATPDVAAIEEPVIVEPVDVPDLVVSEPDDNTTQVDDSRQLDDPIPASQAGASLDSTVSVASAGGLLNKSALFVLLVLSLFLRLSAQSNIRKPTDKIKL